MKVSPNASAKKPKYIRIITWVVSVLLFFVLLIFIAFKVSPWPSVWLIRNSFHKGGLAANEKLLKYTPQGIVTKIDLWYDSAYSDTKLDLYYPRDSQPGIKHPLLIWVHGGGFVAGDKSELSNYCKILASKGYIVASANYSLAPKGKYPLPVSQINNAVAFLVHKADEYGIDSSQVIVGGDSGGAHITAQLANIFTSKEYAAILQITPSVDPGKLKGVILHCGPYNTTQVDFNGNYGSFLKTILWSYIGTKDFKNAPEFVHFSVANFVTENFPKTFISVGNADPLKTHSYDLASKLSSKGVMVDSLFFPDSYSPPLPHEYQFDLDTDAGKLSLERTIKFLSVCTNTAK